MKQKNLAQLAAYALQRRSEGRDPLRGHPVLERLLQLCADRLELGHEVPAFLGQEDPNGPSIIRIILPHHQLGALHAIEMTGERRTVEAEVVRELLHLHAVLLPQTGEDEQMVIGDPEPPQPAIIKFRDPSGRDVQEKANMLVQPHRSEEHTSELQSRETISYAV